MNVQTERDPYCQYNLELRLKSFIKKGGTFWHPESACVSTFFFFFNMLAQTLREGDVCGEDCGVMCVCVCVCVWCVASGCISRRACWGQHGTHMIWYPDDGAKQSGGDRTTSQTQQIGIQMHFGNYSCPCCDEMFDLIRQLSCWMN